MRMLETLPDSAPLPQQVADPADLFGSMLQGTAASLGAPRACTPGPVVGELVALRAGEPRALVVFPGLEGAVPVAARSVVDLCGAHIGKSVVLLFDHGDASSPIVMGVVHEGPAWPAPHKPRQVEIDADGERLLVGAKRQLVLQCGGASITLASDGTVSIRGKRIVSEAEGANCVRGASVQLN